MKNVKRLIVLNTVFVSGCTCIPLISDTVFLESWKKKLEIKSEETPTHLTKKLHDLVNTVTSEMKLKRDVKSLIKPYLTNGLNIVHHGYAGPGAVYGAIIGVPQNYLLDEKLPINFSAELDNLKLSADSHEHQVLKNALFLNNDAMKFALAHEIYETIHPSYYPMIVFPLVLVILINGLFLWKMSKNTTKLNKTNVIFRSQVMIWGIGLYFIISDLVTIYRECDADFKAAKLGKSYLEAGIDFYKKMIERNKVLKKLNKNVPYTEDGDINTNWLRTTHMALPRRLTYLNDLKSAAEKKQKAPNVWDYIFLKEILQK